MGSMEWEQKNKNTGLQKSRWPTQRPGGQNPLGGMSKGKMSPGQLAVSYGGPFKGAGASYPDAMEEWRLQ